MRCSVAHQDSDSETFFSTGGGQKRGPVTELAATARKRRLIRDTEWFEHQESISHESLTSAALLFTQLVRRGKKTLVFCKTRKTVEVFYDLAIQRLHRSSPPFVNQIGSYRAGYSDIERRRIESNFKSGLLIGLVSTNALELGVDIGDIEVTLHIGFPNSVSSFWQQIGRSGRSTSSSYSILFCSASHCDQYIVRNPRILVGKYFEQALFDPGDPIIVSQHAACADKELAFTCCSGNEEMWFFFCSDQKISL